MSVHTVRKFSGDVEEEKLILRQRRKDRKEMTFYTETAVRPASNVQSAWIYGLVAQLTSYNHSQFTNFSLKIPVNQFSGLLWFSYGKEAGKSQYYQKI